MNSTVTAMTNEEIIRMGMHAKRRWRLHVFLDLPALLWPLLLSSLPPPPRIVGCRGVGDNSTTTREDQGAPPSPFGG
jgi:hypothetical protein